MSALGALDGSGRAGDGIDPTAPLARANPLAKLVVSLVISMALVLSVDVVSAGVALGLELLALPWCGLAPRALARRGWILVVAAVPAAVATAVLGDSDTPLASGLAIGLRVFAIGLPGVVLLATTDPTDLADALAQRARLPSRFVLAALASMRLFGVLAEEWAALTMARRARGIGGGGPIERAGDWGGRLFALLVLAIRRGAVLATTMESRGFGTSRPRTWARESRLGAGDLLIVLGGLALVAVAVGAAMAAGTWDIVIA